MLRIHLFLTFLIVFFVVGCGEKRDLVAVTGTITMDGAPLQSVNIEFWPESTFGMRSFAKTDENGSFELETDDRKFKGAAPGMHRIALRDTWYMRDYYVGDSGETVEVDLGEKSRISFDYYQPTRSSLALTVERELVNHFDIVIDTKGRVVSPE